MGADIHSMIERRLDGKWEALDAPVFPAPYYNPDRPIDMHNYPYTTLPYTERNYVVFAFLADVRNGRGFAGSDTGDRITPISYPRGVPWNASPEWKKYVDDWGSDLHSTSYFTLAELLAADWDQVITKRGVLDEAEYLKVRGSAADPSGWCGFAQGPGLLIVTPEEYEAGVRGEKSTMVKWEWVTTMRDYAGNFLTVTLPTMERIAPATYAADGTRTPDFDAIRMVFGFDN